MSAAAAPASILPNITAFHSKNITRGTAVPTTMANVTSECGVASRLKTQGPLHAWRPKVHPVHQPRPYLAAVSFKAGANRRHDIVVNQCHKHCRHLREPGVGTCENAGIGREPPEAKGLHCDADAPQALPSPSWTSPSC
jgi:hypothetical protein